MSLEDADDSHQVDQDTAIDILTRIQQGVPPNPEHIKYIRVGREEEERRICEKPTESLQSVKRGSGQIFFVLGDFGYGKSFFINLIADRASEVGFIRSEFDIQDLETISDKGELYKGIVQNIRYPDEKGKGVTPLLRKFCENVSRNDFDRVASERGFFGHSIHRILRNLLDAWATGHLHVKQEDVTLDRVEVLSAVSGYLQGEDISLEELHAIGKKGFDNVTKENEYEYLRHLRSLALELGYSGFVILIDEAAEQLEWNPDSETTQRLIDLYNKCYQKGQFEHMMFVFVGNEEKWNSLIDEAGHQALQDRYRAKKLVLSKLTEEDYEELVSKVTDLINVAYGQSSSLSKKEISEIVEDAADNHNGINELSPRRLLLTPEGREESRTLVDVIESRLM
ncbi:ATP-binding protein [Halogeometricum sp. S1BR25-6]|uniref:ATP-binding protein n=1 Tax=Halogeometricum salsisoli TaxID=2950536 RepID=A0ABU2GLF8_9EURY|nr:BREX system ATP-binding domain-containing protein [Halogeometricum sp. S1BR25-6]MDS0300908.1 ATP-binding protein [Halogeometricum sp. S1BR25-6]